MLLLNSALTVCAGKSNSHAQIWKPFTDKLVEGLLFQELKLKIILFYD